MKTTFLFFRNPLSSSFAWQTRRVQLVRTPSLSGGLLFAILISATLSYGQHPEFYLSAGGGLWKGQLKNDPRATGYARTQLLSTLSGGIAIGKRDNIAWTSEVGLLWGQMKFAYGAVYDSRQLITDVNLLYANVSSGITYRPVDGLSLRIALGLDLSMGSFGRYTVEEFFPSEGMVPYYENTHGLRGICNWGNFGPVLDVGYQFPLKNGGRIGPRVSAFAGPEPIVKANFRTPFNPRMHRLSLEVVYSFPSKGPR